MDPVEYREHLHRDINIRMSVAGVAYIILRYSLSVAYSYSSPETKAIYSGSKWVTIPSSAAHAVRPQDTLAAAVRSLSVFQVSAVVCLNNGVESVGGPPSDLFSGCTLVRRDAIISFDFLLLLG
jgi:hypothetical protein